MSLTFRLRRAIEGARSTVSSGASVAFALGGVYGPRRAFVAWYRARRAQGRPIHVEDLPGARTLASDERRANGPTIPPRPARQAHPFKARTMRSGSYPPPESTLAYRDPPLSGLTLAGVGETVARRTIKFYHHGYAHIYGAMNLAFHAIATRQALVVVQRARFDNRRAVGPVAPSPRPVDDPATVAAELKAFALARGATHAGCTEVVEHALYAHVTDHLPRAIVLAAPMDRSDMLTIPSVDSGKAIIEGYLDVGRAANDLAQHIRAMGWRAEADTNLGGAPSKVMHVPLAVAAGLGTMGRHTSLITESHGSNVRLATVMTDVPLVLDAPVDFGVDRMCADCRVCRESCPSNAIYETKRMVRGIEKWHLDFDRCMPYFNENETCGICITVCPWSKTGEGPLLALYQQQRARVQARWAVQEPEAAE